jgi:hypothetical protein
MCTLIRGIKSCNLKKDRTQSLKENKGQTVVDNALNRTIRLNNTNNTNSTKKL